MKIEKGMAVNVEDASEIVRQAVVKKFEDLGFELNSKHSIDDCLFYIGFSSSKLFSSPFADLQGLTEITLSKLMFCDQADEMTHCYYDDVDGFGYCCAGDIKLMGTLICTREPAESKSWHEKGELPPVGELAEYSLNGKAWQPIKFLFNDGVTLLIEDAKYAGNRWMYKADDPDLQFRPIKSEREKLIDRGERDIKSLSPEIDRAVIARLIDAGWRPENGE